MSNSAYYSICYEPLAQFLHSGDKALLIQRFHYWLQNDKAGYLLKDETKWIYWGYEQITEQFSWLSKDQIGRMVRHLESIGWLISDHFYNLKRNIGFIGKPPDFHEDNQRKWYHLDYQKIFEDTGFDLLFASLQPPKQPKRARKAILQNCTLQSAPVNDAICNSAQSSISKENLSIYQNENLCTEKDKRTVNQIDELLFDPWADEPLDFGLTDVQKISVSTQVNTGCHDDKCSAAGTLGTVFENESFTSVNNSLPEFLHQCLEQDSFENRKSSVNEVASIPISSPVHEDGSDHGLSSRGFGRVSESRAAAKGKQESTDVKEQEIWEMAPGKPYSVFLNWRADNHYKPQGGRWERDACGNAYAEFYNHRQKTTNVLFPQFLKYVDQVTQNCHQAQAQGMKATLPSCFVMPPEPTPENVRQLMENLEVLVNQGAEVALPTGAATPACIQSMSFDVAASTDIQALPTLEPVSLPAPSTEVSEDLISILERKQTIWRTAPILRSQVKDWAEKTPGIVMTPDGPALASDFSP